MLVRLSCLVLSLLFLAVEGAGQTSTAAKPALAPIPTLGPYRYETKPDGGEFAKLNPRKAPPTPEQSLLRKGDRLTIIGDSITEQKMYSRIIETYLTVCLPQLEIETRQLGWSGETAERFLKRMDQDCLRFDPTIATLCYGMNDAKYRPFDFNNSLWFADHYGAIAERLKQAGARVILGSPGCAGKIAKWTRTKAGTLDEHNQHLCALRDLTIEIASNQRVGFADVFWPMYVAQVQAAKKYSTEQAPYDVAGKDGIHPGWAGHTIMAYAFLRSLGVDGNLADFDIDAQRGTIKVSDGHEVTSSSNNEFVISSQRYPFCGAGEVNDDGTIRSGMTLVPFNEKLNRWTLRVRNLNAPAAMVRWGEARQQFTREELAEGINLADRFVDNPFRSAFESVDNAVAAKQAFETIQIKKIFHGPRGKADIEKAAAETEAERFDLLEKIESAMTPVTHTLEILQVVP